MGNSNFDSRCAFYNRYRIFFDVHLTFLVAVIAMDALKAVSVMESKEILVEEPNYPDLVYCSIVARLNQGYTCSLLMLGNKGPVEVAFSNVPPITLDIQGINY